MSRETNIGIAQQLLARIGEGKDPDAVAALFSEDVVFEILGDNGVLPWIGRNTGRTVVADFIRGIRNLAEPIKFNIQDICCNLVVFSVSCGFQKGLFETKKIASSSPDF